MNIRYNNKTPEDFDCWLATRPVITPSEIERDRYRIPGRRGELLGIYETRGNATITFTIHQKITSSTTHSIDEIIGWLQPFNNVDYVDLSNLFILSNDTSYCYEIINSRISEYVNRADDYKRIEVELEVQPFKYRINETSTSSTSFNLKTDTAEPVISFTCSATSSTITLNGYQFTVYQTPNNTTIKIDTRERMAFYLSGGARVNAEQYIDCDYEKIRLHNGANTFYKGTGVTATIAKTREGYVV